MQHHHKRVLLKKKKEKQVYQQGANPKVVCLHSIEREAPGGEAASAPL